MTFSSLTSLRGLPYRIVCLLGMDDGMLPSLARADEFDLMATFGKPATGSAVTTNAILFLDLLLAARDRLLIAYTGRSIRDNAALPPAALIDELLDYLEEVWRARAQSAEIEGRAQPFVFDHPLQAFAPDYFLSQRDCSLTTPDRAELASLLAAPQHLAAVPFFD